MANITESEFRTLVESGAVRAVEVRRSGHQGQQDAFGQAAGWVVWANVGTVKEPHLRLLRAKRDPVRVFRDLERLASFLRDVGVGRFTVEQG